LRQEKTLRQNGSLLIAGGADPELLLLGAADAGHAEAGQWLVQEHGASGIVTVVSGDGSSRIARDVGAGSIDVQARGFFSSLDVRALEARIAAIDTTEMSELQQAMIIGGDDESTLVAMLTAENVTAPMPQGYLLLDAEARVVPGQPANAGAKPNGNYDNIKTAAARIYIGGGRW